MSNNWTGIISINNMAKLEKSKISYKKIISLRVELGNKLLKCENIEEIFNILFQAIEKEIHPQVTSVFIFKKEAYIERIARRGIDKEGIQIKKDWLIGEKYQPGESFSGLAVKPLESSMYGESILCEDILEEFRSSTASIPDSEPDEITLNNFKYGKDYYGKLGFLKSGISVPLNGTHRTFGAIEVLNKVDPKTGKPDPKMSFSEEELCWLTVVGAHVSAAISRLRKALEDQIINFLSSQIVKSNERQGDQESVTSVYESVANSLVNHELMPYKACIIRVLEGSNLLVAANICSACIDPKTNASRTIHDGMVGEVFCEQEYKDLKIEEGNIHKFYSRQWIEDNQLKKFFCFPCLIGGKVVGIISLYTGYNHELDQDDINFLKCISSLVAAYRVGVKEYADIYKEGIRIPITVPSGIDKELIIKLMNENYKNIFDNYADVTKIIENKYKNELDEKNKEIEIYKRELENQGKLLDDLASKPIVIESESFKPEANIISENKTNI